MKRSHQAFILTLLFLLLIVPLLLSDLTNFINNRYSIFDYEGFSIKRFFFYFFGFYLIYTTSKRSKKGYKIEEKSNQKLPVYKKIILGILGIVMIVMFSYDKRAKDSHIKYNLPLFYIETVEIEGELVKDISVSRGEHRNNMSAYTSRIELKDYPGYTFSYPRSRKLKEKKVEEGERMFESNSNPKIKMKAAKIPSGEIIKIKVRSKDYERMKANEPSKKFLGWTVINPRKKGFYSIEYAGEILIEKEFIK